MLQGSKGQVTVNGSNQIQTSCGNLDHAHLGFDNTTNNQQQITDHEPRTTKHNPWLDIPKVDLGLQSSTTFNHLSTGLAQVYAFAGTSSEASWRFLAFWQTKG